MLTGKTHPLDSSSVPSEQNNKSVKVLCSDYLDSLSDTVSAGN